ncbi:recombinase family protein [Holosporaceae bacterium 'Namur']|nr:recombinase family protein [Holosporaceae bacterium 'Namur']
MCVVRLDRLGRSLKGLLETVEYLKVHKIGLMSLEEKIDTSSAVGELVFHVFSAIAGLVAQIEIKQYIPYTPVI